MCLIKTDELGNEMWTQHFGGTNHDKAYCVQQTTDGGYIVVGYTCTNAYYVYLIKIDELGHLVWAQNYSFGGTFGNFGYSVQQTPDGGYIVTGDSNWDILLLKTDEQGNEIWSQLFPVGSGGIGYSVQQTSDGGYIIAGYADFPGNSDDAFLLKTDELGNQVWLQTYGGFASDQGYSGQQTADGGYIIAGSTLSYGAGSSDVYLVKTDEWGQQLWEHTFGGSSYDLGFSTRQTSDGGYIIAGYTWSYGAGSNDVYLIRLAPQGGDNTLFSEMPPSAQTEVAPFEFSLSPPYPNPFNPLTTVRFAIPQATHVKLTIYDLQGRKVAILVDGLRDAGMHEVTWDASDLASGLYFCRIQAGDYSAVRKMMLVK